MKKMKISNSVVSNSVVSSFSVVAKTIVILLALCCNFACVLVFNTTKPGEEKPETICKDSTSSISFELIDKKGNIEYIDSVTYVIKKGKSYYIGRNRELYSKRDTTGYKGYNIGR